MSKGRGLGVSGDEKVFHVEAAYTFFFHIFCNRRYTWSLGTNIFFTTFEEEFISKFFLATKVGVTFFIGCVYNIKEWRAALIQPCLNS